MPYRALMWTMVTVGVGLVAIAMWLMAVEPLLAGAQKEAASRPVTTMRFNKPVIPPEVELNAVAKGTLMLGFLVMCFLLVVGMSATYREWMRYRGGDRRGMRKRVRTPYVDAWKIAGERLKTPEEPKADGEDEK